MDLRRFVRLFYGFQFFFSLLLWAPVFYEYQKRMGLSDAQIFGIQSWYYIAFCLFEIPTGWLADRWSQRKCMLVGSVLLVAANLLVIFETSYDGFLAHWLLIALSRSLISGASSAYLYNYLQHHGQPDWYKQAEGRARAYSLVGKVTGWAGIGFLMEWRLDLPYWLTALSAAIAVVFALMLPEFRVTGGTARISPLTVLGAVARSPYMLLVIVQGIGIFVLARIVQVNIFQPVLESKSFGLGAFGAIMAVNTLFEAVGAANPGWFRRWMSDLNAVFVITIVMAVSCSLTAWSGQGGAIVWLTVFALATGFSYPIQRQVLNDAVPDSRFRASVLSVESLLDRAVCAWVAVELGRWVAAGKVDEFLHLSNVITLAVVLVLIVAFRILPRKAVDRASS